MKDRAALLREFLLVFVIGVLPLFFMGGCTAGKSEDEPASPLPHVQLAPNTKIAVTLGAYALFVLTPLIAIRRSGQPLSHFGIVWHGWSDVKAGLICFLLNYVTGWIVWWIYWATNFPLGVEHIRAFHYVHASSFLDLISTWPWYILVIYAEEQMARCYLLTRIRDITGSANLAIFGSSALYALWHLFWGWAGALHVFVGGLLFGIYFVKQRGAGSPAVSHFVYDALTLLPR